MGRSLAVLPQKQTGLRVKHQRRTRAARRQSRELEDFRLLRLLAHDPRYGYGLPRLPVGRAMRSVRCEYTVTILLLLPVAADAAVVGPHFTMRRNVRGKLFLLQN